MSNGEPCINVTDVVNVRQLKSLVETLREFATGEVNLSSQQFEAIKIVFNKVIPDIKPVDFDEAFKEGYYSDSMTREEFMNRVTKYNPQLRWYQSEVGAGLFDSFKGSETKGFLCAIGRNKIMPAFTFLKYDVTKDEVLNYCTEEGEPTHKQIINREEDNYRCLARSWRGMFNIIKNLGYKIDDEELL